MCSASREAQQWRELGAIASRRMCSPDFYSGVAAIRNEGQAGGRA